MLVTENQETTERMTSTPGVEVNGEVVDVGTSLFNTDTGEVYWYSGVTEGSVHLQGVEQSIQIDMTVFRRLLRDGDLEIESQPPGV